MFSLMFYDKRALQWEKLSEKKSETRCVAFQG